MNLTTYQDAIAELAVPKLTAFLKLVEDTVEIEGWAKLRAPEKREQLLEAFKQSTELRKEFVVYYADTADKDADFSEWEIESAQAESPDEPEAESPAPTPTGTTLSPIHAHAPTAFVESAFEQIVSDVAGLDAQASKISLSEAEDRMEFEHVRIGALLSHIQKSQHYLTLGYDNLREFLAAETAMDYRKGTYLITNYNKVRDLGIPADALKGVTWSALRHVVPILTEKNYKKWLDAARASTHVKLIEQASKEKAKQAGALPPPDAGDGAAEAKPITKTFNVFPDQDETIKAAIEKAKGQANVESNGAALEILAAAYTGAPPSDTTVGAVLPDTSEAGFKTIFTKLKSEQGIEALYPILSAIGEVFSEVDITAEFPQSTTAAE